MYVFELLAGLQRSYWNIVMADVINNNKVINNDNKQINKIMIIILQ